jgi:Allene oxide cyclase barrel like domain
MGAKLRLFAVLALALTIAVVSLVPAATGAKKHGKKVQILNLTTRTVQEAELDLGASGPSVGDRFVFSDNVFRGDRQVGVLGTECVVVWLEPNPVPEGQEPTSARVNCVGTIQLPKGQLTLQGLVTFSEQSGDRFTVAITGGTGAYRTAHGEATITSSEDENAPAGLRLKIIR